MNKINANELWTKSLSKIESENKFSDFILDTFIKKLVAVSVTNGIFNFYIETKNNRDFIMNKHYDYILSSIKELESSITALNITTDINNIATTTDNLQQGLLNNTKLDLGLARKNANLKEHYLFENFVKGDCNDFAFNISMSIAKDPGNMETNPLFFYGGVGLGKTHLMQAIGNYTIMTDVSKRVYYTSFENFFTEFIDALASKESKQFRDKYKSLNLLLIDDIQFIANKEKVQHEIFTLFEDLKLADVQIVFTSDRPPREIENLSDRLESRFSTCLVDIRKPDYETRLAIIKTKSNNKGIVLSDEIVYFLADSIDTNVRDLENAFNLLVYFMKINNLKAEQMDLSSAKDVLKNHIASDKKKAITAELVQETVAEYFDIEVESLSNKSRSAKIVYPRQLAIYLLRKNTEQTFKEIGKNFNKDHSTVISSIKKIEADVKNKMEVRLDISNIENKLKGK